MKNIFLVLTMIITIQAFSQEIEVQRYYTENEINMILDTTYVFFILNDTVYFRIFRFKTR